MAKWDDAKTHNQIKAYPRGSAQGGRAIQAVKGGMSDNDGTSGHRTIMRETSEGRAIARTRDEMPMVEVEKQACEIGVDHGAIDLHTIAPLHPDAYKDGDLYFTAYVSGHISAAVPDDPDRPIVDEIEPPDSVKGTPPVDGAVAKSVTARGKADKREGLYAKKVMMALCPASIFTGRTRLWVQALYGRHDELGLVSLAGTLPSATPALRIAGTEENEVWITTSTGVYKDPVTAKHWMIAVAYDKVTFYPLETEEDCIDELRSFLLDPAFPVEDKERVETYILADSKPDIASRQEVSITPTQSFAMGYGWHFNWTGDRCDIVFTNTQPASGGGEENESTHYRLEFSKSPTDVWSVTRTVVEGPTRWKSYRHLHVIATPEWDSGMLGKVGAHNGPLPHGNAPFYAFYVRDDLKVCRYSATTTEEEKYVVNREPYYYNPASQNRIGSDAVDYETMADWSGSAYTMTCGSVSASGVEGAHMGAGTRSTGGSDTGTVISFGAGGYWSIPVSLPVGYPSGIQLFAYTDDYGTYNLYNGDGLQYLTHDQQSFGPFDSVRSERVQISSTVSVEVYSATHQDYCRFIGVVPFYDAEAFYLYGSQSRHTTENGTTGSSTGVFFEQYRIHETQAIVATYAISDSVLPASMVPYTTVRPVENTTTTRFIGNAGVISGVAFPGAASFLAPELEFVAQQYDTRSSASGHAASSEATGVDVGNHPTSDANIYVGWA